jgi:hypothetical protein
MQRLLSLLLAIAVLATGCGKTSEPVLQNPPPRLPAQVGHLPPREFYFGQLVVEAGSGRKPYCFYLDELTAWLDHEGVDLQTWTLLTDGRWRLDGFDPGRKEHTVWVFQQFEEGIQLVGYKDSGKAARTAEGIMSLYARPLRSMYHDVIRVKYSGCRNPYA